MTTITINASNPYDVLIGGGLTSEVGARIRAACPSGKIAIITDDIVDCLYGARVCESLSAHAFSVVKYVFPNGEASKNIVTLSEILEYLAENDITRKDTLLALGGGVVGDITGFAASVYMRGVSYIQMPTTLLAAVDASVGGKTAVDLNHGKNLAGAFWQPRMVLCDTDIMRDLPKPLMACGMGEVIKHGVLSGADILDAIERGEDQRDIEWLIKRNVEIKRGFVEADERESGTRRMLNFGHTIAHAIEKTSGYTVPHGKAVGTGMVYETRLAEKLELCEPGLAERVKRCCDRYGLFAEQVVNDEFIKAMTLDKKNEQNRIVFALPKRVGEFRIARLTIEEVRQNLI